MIVAELIALLGLKSDKGSFTEGNALIKSVENTLKGLLAVDIAGVFKRSITEVIDLGGKLTDMSQSAGLSVEALQEFGFAAKLSGSSMEGFAASVGILGRNLESVKKNGKGPVADAFRKLGISLKDPAVKAGDLDAVIMKVADALARLPDGPQKISVAMALLGKSGKQMIPVLNGGSAALQKLRDEAIAAGRLTTEQAGGLDEVGDSVDRLKYRFDGLRNQFVAKLIPVLIDVTAKFIEWFDKARPSIIDAMTSSVNLLLTGIRLLAENWEILTGAGAGLAAITAVITAQWLLALNPLTLVVAAIAALVTAAMLLSDNLELLAPILIVLTALVVKFGLALLTTGKAWLVALGPIALVVAAVAALTYVVVRFRKQIWDALQQVGASFKRVWAQIVDVARRTGSLLVTVATAIKDAIMIPINVLINSVKWVVRKIEWAYDKVKGLGDIFASESEGRAASGFGPLPPEAAAFTVPNPSRAGGIGAVNTTVNVTTGSGDPQKIAQATRDAFDSHWDRKMAQVGIDG